MKQKIRLKKCRRCGIRKALCEFRVYKKDKTGYYYYCKDCEKEYKQQWYLRNKEKVDKRNREWMEKNKDRMAFLKRESKKKWYDKVYAKELFEQRGYELLNDYFPGCSFIFTGVRKVVAIPKWVKEMCYDLDERVNMKKLMRYYGSFENMLKNKPGKKNKVESSYKQFRRELREMLMPKEGDSEGTVHSKKRLMKALRL